MGIADLAQRLGARIVISQSWPTSSVHPHGPQDQLLTAASPGVLDSSSHGRWAGENRRPRTPHAAARKKEVRHDFRTWLLESWRGTPLPDHTLCVASADDSGAARE